MALLDAATVKTALQLTDGDLEWSRANVQYKQTIINDTCLLYNLQGNPFTVAAPDVLRYTDKGFDTAFPTAALTGTAIAGGVTEAQIVSGGETIIITLTGGTWAASGSAFNAIRQSILDAITSSSSGAYSGDTAISAMAVTSVARTSDTVVTITLAATAAYGIIADDTWTVMIPAGAAVSANGNTINRAWAPASNTLTVTAGVPTIALTGTIVAGGVLESQIVTGGETAILTVTGAKYQPTGALFNAVRQGIISGFDGDHAEAHSWDTDIKAAAAVTTVARTSDSVATFTTPAAATYSITTTDEIVTVTIPRASFVHSVSGETYSGAALVTSPTTFTITQGS